MVLERFDQETTKLIPGEMEMMSTTELSQYNIEKWQLSYFYLGEISNNYKEGIYLEMFQMI